MQGYKHHLYKRSTDVTNLTSDVQGIYYNIY